VPAYPTRYVPIHGNLANLTGYVLDADLEPVPAGIAGEMYIGGVGVGRGYLHDPARTAQVFVPDPFLAGLAGFAALGARMYKTGDKARVLVDGTIEFLGRVDHQVKVRGHRIEIGEIESALAGHEQIREAAVVATPSGSGTDARLIAYVVPRDRPWPLVGSIAEYLGLCLPDYMVPSHIVLLEALPLLDNGKINRRALTERELDSTRPGVSIEPPVGAIETAIAEVWSELLETPVGRAGNFFELGGHSLLAVQASSRLRKRLGREVSVRDQFEARTVIELAKRLAANAGSGASAASVFAAHPIERLPPSEIYPLSAYQLPEWFIHELEPDLLVFSVSLADVMFVGDFHVDVFVAAWQALVDRHPIFRTTFANVDGQPVQRVRPSQLVRREDIYIDRTQVAEPDVEPMLRELTAKWTSHIFDFETEPLFVVKLIELSAQRFFFMFHTHHIVWDETSTMVMSREVAELYNAKLEGRQPRLGPAPLSYGDFSVWITRALAEGWLDDQRRYWLEAFRDIPPPLDLPIDFPRPPIQTFRGASVEGRRGGALHQRMTAFLAERELTLNVFLHSVLNAELFKLTGQRDFVVGTPFGNRADQELEGVLGLFATALPVRCTIAEDTTFEQLIAITQRTLMEALDHPLYPSMLAIQEINPAADLSRGRLFSVMYGLQNDKRRLLDELRFTGTEVRPISFVQEAIEQSAPFELTWVFDHDDQGLFLRLDYNTDLYSEATARRWVELFFDCAEQVVERPDLRLTDLRSMTASDERRVIEGFNATDLPVSPAASVVELIAAQCARTPDAIAVIASEGSWTYRELERHANQLAHVLREEGVGFETAVGVCLAPSRERVAAVLAILKAGGSYVPVNPDEPEARQRLVRDTARLHRLLVDDVTADEVGDATADEIAAAAGAAHALTLASLVRRAAHAPAAAPHVTLHPRQRAYVLFTSGSTGTPKGIAVEHGGIVNLVGSTQQRYQLSARDAVLALTPLSFDASVLDLFWTLAHGARLVIPSAGDQRSPAAIGALIQRHDVSLFQTVPALLAELVHARAAGELPALASLRQVICGGSALSRKLRDEFCAAFPCALANHYGPTEVTVDASAFDARQPCAWSVMPIGAPVANARIYVVDAVLQPVALGSVGEIVVASPGLARGYLGEPAKTAAAFVPDPFGDGGRLYRTGDLGRHDANGVLHFVGRADKQVKIHGHRVELEDIESQLGEHPAIVEVAVRTTRDPEDGLVAYVELADGFGRVVEGEQVLQLVTLAQRPELKAGTDRVHQQAWPEYFAAGASLQTYWPRLATEFPEFQYALLDASDEIVAVGNALPIQWDGTVDDLPGGWDDGLARGFAGAAAGRTPDTFFILTGIVAESAQGKGLATAVLKAFKSLARALGFARVVVAVRPTGKSAHPTLAFDDYVALCRPDGLREDAWVRTHERVGGKILKIDPTSQVIRAGIADWQRWAGTTFTQSGDYHVKDALQPVRIDLEAGVGEYFDPSVWIEHPADAGEGYPGFSFRHVDGAQLRAFARQRLPEHMVPTAFRFVTRLPRTSAGKLDEQRLALASGVATRNARFRPASTPTQDVLVEIWRAVLEGEAIGVLDDFFSLGGHSIRAVQMLLRVTQRLGVEVSLKEFYRDPTIVGLERLIQRRGDDVVARKTAPAAAPSVGFGKARGHHGEILQGVFEVADRRLRRGLVSLPCPVLYSEAIFTSDDSGVVRVEPSWKTKAGRAAELMLAAADAGRAGGHLELRSNIQVGWGLGSSTSDVVATLRAVAHALRFPVTEPALAALAVQAEQASDSIMFEEHAVLFAHREGLVVEALGAPLPAVDVLGFNTSADEQGRDTLTTPRARYSAAEIDTFRELVELLRRAVARQDPGLLGQVATGSARISQRHLAKPRFEALARLVDSVGAVGLQVAHSGTVVGVLFDPREDDREARILRARSQILELGFRRIRRFRSSAV
jgi:amino acid adenylation domain-containing protein